MSVPDCVDCNALDALNDPVRENGLSTDEDALRVQADNSVVEAAVWDRHTQPYLQIDVVEAVQHSK